MLVKPLTKRERKGWWCSSLDEVHLGDSAIIETYILSSHPVGHDTRTYFPKFLEKKYINMQIKN
jgi:hypothetical protein